MTVILALDAGVAVQRIHDALLGVFDAAGYELPRRRYITVGEPEHLCGEFSTSFVGAAAGPIGAAAEERQTGVGLAQRNVTVVVDIVRCWEVPDDATKAIPVDRLTTVGTRLASDASALLEAAIVARNDGTLTDKCNSVTIGPVTSLGPEGGLAGVRLQLRIEA